MEIFDEDAFEQIRVRGGYAALLRQNVVNIGGSIFFFVRFFVLPERLTLNVEKVSHDRKRCWALQSIFSISLLVVVLKIEPRWIREIRIHR